MPEKTPSGDPVGGDQLDANQPGADQLDAEQLGVDQLRAGRPEAEDRSRNARSAVRKPSWLRVRLPGGEVYQQVKELKTRKTLHTVCEEALCPNIAECWGSGTATFLILGSICTRNCHFCNVKSGHPRGIDPDEPERVAQAAAALGLRHTVVTSVTRDDLPDGGATWFAETIQRVRSLNPGCTVEVLIPDFQGSTAALARVVEARPEILGHNLETVRRLYPQVRPQADYDRSLHVLQSAKMLAPDLLTKSGVMVGLGETRRELVQAMTDLRRVGCDILTLGQYLSPTRSHLEVVRYYPPEEFKTLKEIGRSLGYRWVEAGPLVRSSYRAESQARALKPGCREDRSAP